MTILLTGATGTLGSRILFSLLEEKFSSITYLFLAVREKKSKTPESRIFSILNSEHAPAFIKENKEAILKKLKIVPASKLLNPDSFLEAHRITHFIHAAGLVNLSTNPDAKAAIFEENLDFTKRIFMAYKGCMDKFIYISTAFSIGEVQGLISNDYLNTAPATHRNYYEASKYATEKFVAEAAAIHNVPFQILRPSVLGGNAIDTPKFFISKYMVFYLFAKFFYRAAVNDKVRIVANVDSGLNIIPTDYAAKVIVAVFDTSITQLNIVHAKTTDIQKGITKILHTVNFRSFEFTSKTIDTSTTYISKLEKFYYQTIGIHLTPYLTAKPCEWDTTVLEEILPMPSYDLEAYLEDTLEYAKTKDFKNQSW